MSTSKTTAKRTIPKEELPPSFRKNKPVVLPHSGGYQECSESELVEKFAPMVLKWVYRLAYHSSLYDELDDLRNIGLTALIKAKRNFKPELGVPFEAYCSTRIRGAILDGIRKRFPGSRSISIKLKRIESAVQEASEKLGHHPSEKEIASHLDLTLGEYHELLSEVHGGIYVSLNGQWASANDYEQLENQQRDDSQPDPSIEAGRLELQEIIRKKLLEMSKPQQQVLSLYYFEGLRFKDIAEILKVSESRICQIHTEAVLILRSYLNRVEKIGTFA